MPFIDMTNDPEWSIWLRAVGMGDFKPKRVLTFDSTMIAVEAAMEGPASPSAASAVPRGAGVGPAVPAVPADRRQRQGVVVRVSGGVSGPAQDPRLRGLAGRGTEPPANARPLAHSPRRPSLTGTDGARAEVDGWSSRARPIDRSRTELRGTPMECRRRRWFRRDSQDRRPSADALGNDRNQQTLGTRPSSHSLETRRAS